MLTAGHHLWRLSEGGSESLGLCCTEDGLFLAATPLVERRPSGYVVRAQADLARLLKRAYRAEIGIARLMPGLGVVAAALGENNLCLAQIAALRLFLPDLPDLPARRDLAAEDRLIKSERQDGLLARVGWDPAEHPRAGVPPNRAWFAPAGAAADTSPTRLAQNEENERALEEMLDPLASVRQAQWEAARALLRQLEPGNQQLFSMTGPNWVPSNQDIAAINAVIRNVVLGRVTGFVMPSGHPIGRSGGGHDIRVVAGGENAARAAFGYLSVGGTDVTPSDYAGTLVQLPGNVGYIGLRSSSSGLAVDLNLPGVPYRTLHYR